MRIVCETCHRFVRHEEPFHNPREETERCPNACSQAEIAREQAKRKVSLAEVFAFTPLAPRRTGMLGH